MIRDFFSQENQARKLKLFRMRGAELMLEALRLTHSKAGEALVHLTRIYTLLILFAGRATVQNLSC